jgi:cbb3-type cytochrome oxidase subunit 3
MIAFKFMFFATRWGTLALVLVMLAAIGYFAYLRSRHLPAEARA